MRVDSAARSRACPGRSKKPGPARDRPAKAVPRLPVPLLLAAAGILIAVLFLPQLSELVRLWAVDDTYSHGFLVPVVSAALAWRVWRRESPGEGNLPAGLVWLAGGCVLHLLGDIILLPPLDLAALASVLYGLAVLVGGRGWARRFRFPILFLAFMFPLPAVLTDRAAVALQSVVSALAGAAMDLFVPVFRQGNMLYLPGHQLEVGEACSGLRQVIAFAALTLLVAHLGLRSRVSQAVLVFLSPLVAVAANVLRVLLMALAVCWLGDGAISGASHTAWGMLAAALGLLGLMGLASVLSGTRRPPAITASAADRQPENIAPAAPDRTSALRRGLGAAVMCLGLTLALQGALLAHLASVPPTPAPGLVEPLPRFPMALAEWSGEDVPPSSLPYYKAADDALFRAYYARDEDGRPTGPVCRLWMVHFRDGRDRAHHPLVCYPVAGYREDPAGRGQAWLDGARPPVERFCFTRAGERGYAFYWHYTLTLPTADDRTPLQRLHERRPQALPSLTVTVFTDAAGTDALDRAAAFVRLADAALQAHLPPGARMGSDTLPVRIVYAPGHRPAR